MAIKIFISHNAADAAEARTVGAQLKLVGADVWFDEWEIKAGDSIPGSVDDALQEFDVFVLIWSANAAGSTWVRSELEAAITRRMADRELRVVPVRLDRTPLPPLVAPLKYLDLDDGVPVVVDAIMGFSNERDRLRAIQAVLDEAGIEVEYFHGYGPAVCCPRCGAGVRALKGWYDWDHVRDDEYAGVECTECGWSDGGEI